MPTSPGARLGGSRPGHTTTSESRFADENRPPTGVSVTGVPTRPTEPKECACPKANHVHGTVQCYQQCKCSCEECRAAVSRLERALVRSKAYGLHRPGTVPSLAARRRLQALATLGWGSEPLAAEFGAGGRHLWEIRNGRRATVRRTMDQRVAALYDRLWEVEPPKRTASQRSGATRAKRYARARGWAPPLAWDDEDISDPAAKPHWRPRPTARAVDHVAVQEALAGRSVALSKAERAEAVRVATERRLSAERTAELLGTTARTVVRQRAKAAA